MKPREEIKKRIKELQEEIYRVGDKVWYKNKLRRIIDIKGEDVELWDFGNRIKLKRKALIYDIKHYR
jgi:hypothetical protein